MKFTCCDCGAVEVDSGMTLPNADGSATVQCVACHERSHETDGGRTRPTRANLVRSRRACWACTVRYAAVS